MQFSTLISVALSFATAVLATNGQNSFTYPLGGTVDASVPVVLKWTPSTSGTITIKLLKGPTSNIIDIDVIAASILNSGSYTWNIPNSLQDSGSITNGDKYGLKIFDDTTNTFEYSPPFDISIPDSTYGSGGSASSKSASTSTTATQSATTAKSTSTLATSVKSTATVESSTTTESTAATAIAQSTAAVTESTTLQTVITGPTATAAAETALETTGTEPATETSDTAAKATSITSSNGTTTESNKTPSITIIIGVAVGGIVLIGLAIFSIMMVCRCKNRRKAQSTSAVESAMRQRPMSVAVGNVMTGNGMYNRV